MNKMATIPSDEDSSEDEIFFGKITLKEIRARFIPKEQRRAMRRANRKKESTEIDTSMKIIEMHSEPEMNVGNNFEFMSDSTNSTKISNKANCEAADSSYLRLKPDDSFLRLERLVADCCISENRNDITDETTAINKKKKNDSPVTNQYMITNGNTTVELSSVSKNTPKDQLTKLTAQTSAIKTHANSKEISSKQIVQQEDIINESSINMEVGGENLNDKST